MGINDSLSLGAGVKYIRESIDDISAQGYGFDLGVLYTVPGFRKLVLGAAIRNIGPAVKFQKAKEDLPLNVRAGAAYSFTAFNQETIVSVDAAKESSEKILMGIGLEMAVAEVMPLRLGFNSRNEAGPGITGGLGWKFRNFELDYAIVSFGDLGITHRISASLRWGKPKAGQIENAPSKP